MKDKEKRQARQVSQRLKEELGRFIGPLVKALDEKLDKRLVRTFVKTLEAIIEFRHSSAGLLLSELGAYITNGGQAPAGTKRLSNLLRSPRWNYQAIEDFLWRQAKARLEQLQTARQLALLVWDDSCAGPKPTNYSLPMKNS